MIQYVTAALPSVCSAAILALAALMYRKLRYVGTFGKALKNLQKDRILQSCKYWQMKGYIPMHEREVLSEMEESYVALGGNSFIEREMEKTFALPIEPPVR